MFRSFGSNLSQFVSNCDIPGLGLWFKLSFIFCMLLYSVKKVLQQLFRYLPFNEESTHDKMKDIHVFISMCTKH